MASQSSTVTRLVKAEARLNTLRRVDKTLEYAALTGAVLCAAGIAGCSIGMTTIKDNNTTTMIEHLQHDRQDLKTAYKNYGSATFYPFVLSSNLTTAGMDNLATNLDGLGKARVQLEMVTTNLIAEYGSEIKVLESKPESMAVRAEDQMRGGIPTTVALGGFVIYVAFGISGTISGRRVIKTLLQIEQLKREDVDIQT